jgi:hypothetical protein
MIASFLNPLNNSPKLKSITIGHISNQQSPWPASFQTSLQFWHTNQRFSLHHFTLVGQLIHLKIES